MFIFTHEFHKLVKNVLDIYCWLLNSREHFKVASTHIYFNRFVPDEKGAFLFTL